jgi:hypothetical protein
MNHLQAPENYIWVISNLSEICLFASQGAPLVPTTQVANFTTGTASVADTGGEFATGVEGIIL